MLSTKVTGVEAKAMAGIPPLNGFISKEMMLEEVAHTYWWGGEWPIIIVATMGALFSVAYSFRFISHTFFGPVRDDYPHHPHDPPLGMLASPALLALLVILIGLFPAVIAEPLVRVTASAVTGGELPDFYLSLWHGVTPALFMSMAAVAGGIVLLLLHRPLDKAWIATPRPHAKAMFDRVIAGVAGLSTWITDKTHDGAISRYLAIFTIATVLLGYAAYSGGGMPAPTREMLPVPPLVAVGFVLLIVATGAVVIMHRHRFRGLIITSVVGLMVAAGFIYLSAPDLAMTQITVDTVTVLLLLVALHFLPKDTPRDSTTARRTRDALIGIVAGIGTGSLAFAFLMRDVDTISDYHLANSYKGGGGDNVVNVILVDFRG